jgi:hypothetical protein
MSIGSGRVPDAAWFKSSYSGADTTECVECARSAVGTLIRDSKNTSGPVLVVRLQPWRAFIQALAQAELERLSASFEP